MLLTMSSSTAVAVFIVLQASSLNMLLHTGTATCKAKHVMLNHFLCSCRSFMTLEIAISTFAAPHQHTGPLHQYAQ